MKGNISQLDLDFVIDNDCTWDEMLDDFGRELFESLLLQRLRERLKEFEAAAKSLPICVSIDDAEWAIGKFVKPNTMRAIISRLESKS